MTNSDDNIAIFDKFAILAIFKVFTQPKVSNTTVALKRVIHCQQTNKQTNSKAKKSKAKQSKAKQWNAMQNKLQKIITLIGMKAGVPIENVWWQQCLCTTYFCSKLPRVAIYSCIGLFSNPPSEVLIKLLIACNTLLFYSPEQGMLANVIRHLQRCSLLIAKNINLLKNWLCVYLFLAVLEVFSFYSRTPWWKKSSQFCNLFNRPVFSVGLIWELGILSFCIVHLWIEKPNYVGWLWQKQVVNSFGTDGA